MYIKNRTETKYIILLPTKTKANTGFKEIDRRDRDRGAVMCGAHYIIKQDGMVETGRELDKRGHRRRKFNDRAVYIDIVGKDKEFTKAQYAVAPDIIDELRDLYPKAEVLDFT